MDAKRQKTRNDRPPVEGRQLELSYPTAARGEAPREFGGRVEASISGNGNQSPTVPTVMQEVLDRDNLIAALDRVMGNKGAPGVDGMSVEELPDFLLAHWADIKRQLLEGTYQPQPVRRVDIPKPDGGSRQLGIPTVLDRLIQQAVQQVLTRRWDPTFSPNSFGFRPGRSAHQAVEQAQRLIAEGRDWVVDLDLEKFFDRVNHDRLMGQIMKRETDKALLKLIRSFLTAGVMEAGLFSPTDEGTPQGGPLSPLLSNLVLDELDQELERRGLSFVRYADDCNIYVGSERAGKRVMDGVSRFISQTLKLKVNASKSAVARPKDRKFLGFSFTGGKELKRRIAPKALKRFRERVRELTGQGKGSSLRQVIEPLASYLRGWVGYFGVCQTPSVLKKQDAWIRRRLRCVVLRHWNTGRRLYAELVNRQVSPDLAAKTAGSACNRWRLSKSPALHIALPNALFTRLGLPNVLLE
jgi:RNA-directed DNA polymerase